MLSSSSIYQAFIRGRSYIFLVLAFLLASAAVYSSASNSWANAAHAQKDHTHYNPQGTIDGSINPALIPDSKAYSLLFRFLSKNETEGEKRISRLLIKKMGVREEDVDALIAAAEDFNLQVGELDRQAVEIKRNNRPYLGPDLVARLTLLGRISNQCTA